MASKSNKTLGINRRTLKACSPVVKERAYEALVRPKLEYARLELGTIDLNRSKRELHASIQNDYRSSTSSSELVMELGWNSLEHRRLLHQVSMFYKVRNGLVNIPSPPPPLYKEIAQTLQTTCILTTPC